MIHNLFIDDPKIDALRHRMLDHPASLPPPPLVTDPVANVAAATAVIRDQLAVHGLASVVFASPIDDDDLIRVGTSLGTVMRETAPEIQEFVTKDVVLHLRQRPSSGRGEFEPFETSRLLLHSEGSARPADRQPRYVVLSCVEPGATNTSQTVFVPFMDVGAGLPDDAREVLRSTLGGEDEALAPIVRTLDGREVFSFRDRGRAETVVRGMATGAQTLRALSALITAMYSAPSVYGSQWGSGQLMVIDNHRWFHGRTSTVEVGSLRRHLMRVRVTAP